MGKVLNYQRGTNMYQSPFNGEFPGGLCGQRLQTPSTRQELLSSLQKVEVQDRDEVRSIAVSIAELGSRLGLSNAKFGDHTFSDYIPRIHWSCR